MAVPIDSIGPPQSHLATLGYHRLRQVAEDAALAAHAEAIGKHFLPLVGQNGPFDNQQTLADHLKTSRATANRLVNGQPEVIGKMKLEELVRRRAIAP